MEDTKYIVRIYNTDIEGTRNLLYGLTKIKGVSVMMANAVLSKAGINRETKIGDLKDEDVERLNDILKNPKKYEIPSWMYNRRKDYDTGEDMHLLTTDLKLMKDEDIKRMRKTKSYKGVRHGLKLPVRGQRTKSNFRKNKGKVTGVKRKK